jgi:hypothetical protein
MFDDNWLDGLDDDLADDEVLRAQLAEDELEDERQRLAEQRS